MAERQIQLIDVINKAIKNAVLDIHTATVAKVIKVNEKTIDVKVVINKQFDGESLEFTEFIEVPPVFMQGGGSYSAHPIAIGDYCLLMMTERCFDNWYSGRDNVVPPEFRTHDYSDAFAIVGINPLGKAITIPEVITNIGDTYNEGNIEHKGNLTQEGDTNRTGKLTQEGDIDQTGNQTISGKNDAGDYAVGGTAGVSGAFPAHNGKVVTVTKGS